MNPIFSLNELVITNGSMAGDLTSSAMPIKEQVGYSVQAIWSGSAPVGTMKLQGSLDDVTYTDITSSSLAVSGNTGSNLYNVERAMYAFVKVVYTRASGTGTLNVRISAKSE